LGNVTPGFRFAKPPAANKNHIFQKAAIDIGEILCYNVIILNKLHTQRNGECAMKTDYRRLCVELFGTDNVDELRRIAERAAKKRNAGRKKKFTKAEVQDILEMYKNGETMKEIAKKFGTSRQIISKYLNEKPHDGYMLRLFYMHKTKPCTIIDVDFLNRRVRIQNKTEDILKRAFGVKNEPTFDDFEQFLLERCVPETRGNIKDILGDIQLTHYDPLQIAEKTGGRIADDDMWLKFVYPGERRKY